MKNGLPSLQICSEKGARFHFTGIMPVCCEIRRQQSAQISVFLLIFLESMQKNKKSEEILKHLKDFGRLYM